MRAAVPFLLPALLGLLLCATRAWPVGLAAAGAFATAGAIVGLREERDLRRLRRSMDATLMGNSRPQLSPMLTWRAAEVISPVFREHVAVELRRTVKAATTSSLPGASPVNRTAVRRNAADLLSLADRLDGPDPVDAHGVLLARALVHESTSVLYGPSSPDEADRAVRSALRGLGVEPQPATVA